MSFTSIVRLFQAFQARPHLTEGDADRMVASVGRFVFAEEYAIVRSTRDEFRAQLDQNLSARLPRLGIALAVPVARARLVTDAAFAAQVGMDLQQAAQADWRLSAFLTARRPLPWLLSVAVSDGFD